MPIFPFLSFLLFGNGKEDEEKKEGKELVKAVIDGYIMKM